MPLLVLALSAVVPGRTQVIAVSPEQPAVSEPFELRSGPFGSPLITLRGELPANSAMGLEVELLDSRDAVVLQLSKEGWRETGTWSEDGESGTWDESDSQVELSLRPPLSGTYRLRFTLEDLFDAAGLPLQTPVVVRTHVRQHSVDAPLLWFTAAITLGMVRILQVSVYRNWRQRRVLRVEDSRVAIRLTAGGAGLLRVVVRARYERPESDSPPADHLPAARLGLSVAGPCGERLLDQVQTLRPAKHSNDGDHWLTVQQTLYLRLLQRESVRVRADLSERLDDGGEPWEIEWLALVLEDGLVTPFPVAALPLRVTAERA